jgi:hypothetical protein
MADEVTKRVRQVSLAGRLALAWAPGLLVPGQSARPRSAVLRSIGRAGIGSLEVDELRVCRLNVIEHDKSPTKESNVTENM